MLTCDAEERVITAVAENRSQRQILDKNERHSQSIVDSELGKRKDLIETALTPISVGQPSRAALND